MSINLYSSGEMRITWTDYKTQVVLYIMYIDTYIYKYVLYVRQEDETHEESILNISHGSN